MHSHKLGTLLAYIVDITLHPKCIGQIGLAKCKTFVNDVCYLIRHSHRSLYIFKCFPSNFYFNLHQLTLSSLHYCMELLDCSYIFTEHHFSMYPHVHGARLHMYMGIHGEMKSCFPIAEIQQALLHVSLLLTINKDMLYFCTQGLRNTLHSLRHDTQILASIIHLPS